MFGDGLTSCGGGGGGGRVDVLSRSSRVRVLVLSVMLPPLDLLELSMCTVLS